MKENKENKDLKAEQIKIISEIDQLKVIANNHYLMKKYVEAIKISNKIIDLATKAGLNSIIKEQENFINDLKKMIERDTVIKMIIEDLDRLQIKYKKLLELKEIEKANDLVENFRNNYSDLISLDEIPRVKSFLEEHDNSWREYLERQGNLKKQLDSLEIQFISYYKTNNLKLAKETLFKAKPLLDLLQENILEAKWKRYAIDLLKKQKIEDLNRKVNKTIEKVNSLVEDYKFTDARRLLTKLIKNIEEKNFPKLIKQLKIKLKVITDAEEKYKILNEELEKYISEFNDKLAKQNFKDAMENCTQIIKIARFIGKLEIASNYSIIMEDLKSKIRKLNLLNALGDKIKKLNQEALKLIESEEFKPALDKFKIIKKNLKEFIYPKRIHD
ncbi:MAG: hypothetical protein ACTSO4_03080 [Promethearchaeota archaeon]